MATRIALLASLLSFGLVFVAQAATPTTTPENPPAVIPLTVALVDPYVPGEPNTITIEATNTSDPAGNHGGLIDINFDVDVTFAGAATVEGDFNYVTCFEGDDAADMALCIIDTWAPGSTLLFSIPFTSEASELTGFGHLGYTELGDSEEPFSFGEENEEADLQVLLDIAPKPMKTNDPDQDLTVKVGEDLIVEITITNLGPDLAEGVVAIFECPGAFVTTEGSTTVPFGDMEVNLTQSALLEGHFDEAGTFQCSGQVQSTTDDPNGGNNTAAKTVEVEEDLITYSFQGTKWHDLDGNAARNVVDGELEPGLEGWIIYWDENDNDERDAEEPSATTDAFGEYALQVTVAAGNEVAIREVIPDGWAQSFPRDKRDGEEEYTFSEPLGGVFSEVNFGNFKWASIEGTVFHDTNLNNTRDIINGEPEPGIANQLVYLDLNNNEDYDLSDQETMTDANGKYLFNRLRPGVIAVRVPFPKPDDIFPWLHSAYDPSYTDTLRSDLKVTNNDFALFRPATIRGTKWNDLNGDGERQEDEPPLAGFKIVLEGSNRTTVTDESGNYSLHVEPSPNDETGTFFYSYKVAEELSEEQIEEGWAQTFPAKSDHDGKHVLQGPATESGQVFDNFDFGNYLDEEGDFDRATADISEYANTNNMGEGEGFVGIIGTTLYLPDATVTDPFGNPIFDTPSSDPFYLAYITDDLLDTNYERPGTALRYHAETGEIDAEEIGYTIFVKPNDDDEPTVIPGGPVTSLQEAFNGLAVERGDPLRTPAAEESPPDPSANPRVCAILVHGYPFTLEQTTNFDATLNDALRTITEATAGPRVPPQNVTTLFAPTVDELKAAFAALEGQCDRLIFYYYGHASRRGSMHLSPPLEREFPTVLDELPYFELAQLLADTQAYDLEVVIDAPYAGQALDAIGGWPDLLPRNLTVVPSTARGSAKTQNFIVLDGEIEIIANKGLFSSFFFQYMRDASADTDGQSGVSVQEAYEKLRWIDPFINFFCPQTQEETTLLNIQPSHMLKRIYIPLIEDQPHIEIPEGGLTIDFLEPFNPGPNSSIINTETQPRGGTSQDPNVRTINPRRSSGIQYDEGQTAGHKQDVPPMKLTFRLFDADSLGTDGTPGLVFRTDTTALWTAFEDTEWNPRDSTVTAFDVTMNGEWAFAIVDGAAVVDTDTPEALPSGFVLHGNYPNPFNPTTTLRFDLPESAEVTVEVLDLLGRLVLALPPERFSAGTNHTLSLDAASLSSGTYLYRMVANTTTSTQAETGQFVLIR